VYISEISRRCRKKDREKTVCNAKILKLLLETNAPDIPYYTVFKPIGSKHLTMRWRIQIIWHTILYYYIHILIINILTDFTQSFIIKSFGFTDVMLPHYNACAYTFWGTRGIGVSRGISGVLKSGPSGPQDMSCWGGGGHKPLSLH